MSEALAQETGLRVRVDPTLAECIGAGELEQRVSPLFSDESASVELAVTFSARSPVGYRAEVTLQSANERRERTIESENPDCRDLDEPLLVVIDALASELASSGAETNEPVSQSAATVPARRKEEGEVIVRPEPEPSPAPHLLALGGAVELGALPSASFTARLDGRLSFGRRFGARLGIGTTPWSTSESYSTATVDFRLTSGLLLGCFDWHPVLRITMDTCAGIDAGAVTTTSSGLEQNETTTRPALWAVAEARAGFALGAVVPEVFVSGGPALTRDSYRVAGASGQEETLYRTAPFRGAVGLALGVKIP